MANKEIKIEQLIWFVRRLFQRLASESNDLLSIYDMTAAQRAVLEFLQYKEPETLVNIAREHDVSRQHIQQIVNDLLGRQLVESIENPAHKRSFLVQRTEAGRQMFMQIKHTETTLISNIMQEFDSKDVQTSINTLKKFNELLQSDKWLKLKQQITNQEA